jgi:hypothetical protein
MVWQARLNCFYFPVGGQPWRCRHRLSDAPTYRGGPSPRLCLASRRRCGWVGSLCGVALSYSTPPPTVLSFTGLLPSALATSPLPRRSSSLPVGGCGLLFRWLLSCCCFSLLSRHGVDVVFPSESYLLSPKVCCVELDLELGKSLVRPLSVMTTTAFPNVIFRLGIQIHLVCRVKTQFVPFWKAEQWRCSHHSLFGSIVLHDIFARSSHT